MYLTKDTKLHENKHFKHFQSEDCSSALIDIYHQTLNIPKFKHFIQKTLPMGYIVIDHHITRSKLNDKEITKNIITTPPQLCYFQDLETEASNGWCSSLASNTDKIGMYKSNNMAFRHYHNIDAIPVHMKKTT